ncbi:MAG TPA: RagB/SusD family nutrient uptake outer membrane protein [Chryseolinea sp.]|nr:RagB/SusD family nutrient uptake outer membrane protein [Chryseolinea sp.]HPM29753.1 RagB/SusD family nutrient uptake outer membrane protein [Chryseolinea sp.]
MKSKILFILAGMLLLIVQSCKDELSGITNTNAPTLESLKRETGIYSFAKGGIYINGFGGYYGSIDDGLGNGFHMIVYGTHDSMGDLIFIPWGNNNFKYIDNPTDFTLDDNTVVPMPIGVSQPYETKLRNDRAYGATNGMLPEWVYMYTMNNACNVLLANLDAPIYTGDADTKKNTLKAWAYFWKGYAYSRIGSMYIAGLIIDEPYKTNGDYVTNTEIIAEATKNFDLAITALGSIPSLADYNSVLSSIIPEYCKHENGLPTLAAWIRNINTMKARNLIANTRVEDMTVGDWTQLKTLADAGITDADAIFVIKTTSSPSESIFSDNVFGSNSLYAATNDPTYFISERLIQDYRPGDDRFTNNFSLLPSSQVNMRGRGLGFGTRYFLVDEGNDVNDAFTYVHTTAGIDNHFMAGSYEENELMRAEAEIQLGNISSGVGLIDNVRDFQNANLAAINPASSKDQALEELRSERRVSLLFRGLGFYDARRNGVIDDKSLGGGRAGAVVLSNIDGTPFLNTNTFINYNYLSYWDVPANELVFNSPSDGSASVVTPE